MRKSKEMVLEEDYRDMIAALLEENVRFLVIGGYAVGLHGYQRPTKDIDFLVLPSPENAVRVMKTLERFGAPLLNISAEDFEKEGTIYQIGVAPVRIDIITAVVGVEFEEAYSKAKVIELDGLKFPIISLMDLIRNKKTSGRKRDLIDAEHLEVILKRKNAAGTVDLKK